MTNERPADLFPVDGCEGSQQIIDTSWTTFLIVGSIGLCRQHRGLIHNNERSVLIQETSFINVITGRESSRMGINSDVRPGLDHTLRQYAPISLTGHPLDVVL